MDLRNPYITGRFVEGQSFYGRAALLKLVLNSDNLKTWIVGNRRMGKTSFLYKLADAITTAGQIALFIDLQGIDTAEDLTNKFLDDPDTQEQEALQRLGLPADSLRGKRASEAVALLDRQAQTANQTVWLLIDEAESLVSLVRNGGEAELQDFQRELQRTEHIRVVLSATKRLLALNDLCDKETTPFLNDVAQRSLGRLDRADGAALVRAAQSAHPLELDDAVVGAILDATDCHPFLTQWLCDRLWTGEGLRSVEQRDLFPDPLLSGSFQDDYRALAPIERRILRNLADATMLDDGGLLATLDNSIKPVRLGYTLQQLEDLCYVRRIDAGYSIGNQFMNNWFQIGDITEDDAQVSDGTALEQADPDIITVQQIIEQLTRRRRLLELRQATDGADTPPEVTMEIEDLQKQIATREKELESLRNQRRAA